MFNKFTNKKLGIVFAALIVLFVIMLFWDNKSDRTFREVLVDIDTAGVTEFLLYPKSNNHEEVRLFSEDGKWRVQLNENLSVSVPNAKITSLFNQLLAIVPKRLAARDENKWGDFQVDSTATRIKVIEDGDTTLDLIIGRFSYQQQPRSMSTFVRLANDVDIYEVDGFLEMAFNQEAGTFRDGRLLKSKQDSWKQLSFEYPADSSFQMMKVETGWVANFVNADSVKTAKYLRQLAGLSSTAFIDDIGVEQLGSAQYQLTIETDSGEIFIIKGYDTPEKFFVSSSANEEALFDGNENKLRDKIFIGLNSVLP